MAIATQAKQEQLALGHTWWIFLLQGCAALIIGLLLLSSPLKTVAVLTAFMGLYWIITGIFNIVAVFVHHVTTHKWLVIGSGIISIVAGFIVLDNMIWSAVVLPTLAVIIMGIAALVNGVVTLVAGRQQGEHRDRSWAGFFLGILYILLGVLLLANPLIGAATLVLAIAIWSIVAGIVLIVLAFRVRKLAK